jgi:glycosyltransferase involved in cell wall biosynthesis
MRIPPWSRRSGVAQDEPERLAVIRFDEFSGTNRALLAALGRRQRILDCDLASLGRGRRDLGDDRLEGVTPFQRPGIDVPAYYADRLRGEIERRRTRAAFSFFTAGRSIAGQRLLTRGGVLNGGRPLIFTQTLAAFVNVPNRYVVYTDRVTSENLDPLSRYPAGCSPKWYGRERNFIRGATQVLVMGPASAEAAVRDYGLPESRVVVVGAGCNVPVRGLRRSDSCRTLLFVGVEWERKGGPELLQGFRQVRHLLGDVTLRIVGSSPEGAAGNGVEVLGRVPFSRMPEIYDEADALVLPSWDEPFGIVLVEALSAGIPCVSTTVSNIPWIVGAAGVLVPPGDIAAIGRALVSVVQSYPSMKLAAETRREEIKQEFSYDRVADQALAALAAPPD